MLTPKKTICNDLKKHILVVIKVTGRVTTDLWISILTDSVNLFTHWASINLLNCLFFVFCCLLFRVLTMDCVWYRLIFIVCFILVQNMIFWVVTNLMVKSKKIPSHLSFQNGGHIDKMSTLSYFNENWYLWMIWCGEQNGIIEILFEPFYSKWPPYCKMSTFFQFQWNLICCKLLSNFYSSHSFFLASLPFD